jgi:hypothetical protein
MRSHLLTAAALLTLLIAGVGAGSEVAHPAPPCWSNSPHKACPPATSTTALSSTSTVQSTTTTTLATTTTATTTTVATTTSPSSTTFASETSYPAPAFTALRTIDVSSQSAFMTAWGNIQPGDQINVHGVTFTGQINLTGKILSGWAQISFDSATHFVGVSSAVNSPIVYLQDDSHIRFYGGDLTESASGGQAGFGLLIHGGVTSVSWWGFVVHNVGNTALAVFPAESPSSNLDLKGEVYDWGHNLAFDPHAEKGTGEHGVNLSDAAYPLKDSRVAVYAHDGATGSGMELGSSASSTGNTIYLWCQNLTKVATVQVAGNCLQIWGSNTLSNDVKYLEAENLQGRPFDANGLSSGQSLSTDTIEYGRASNTNLNPSLASTESIPAGTRWDPRGGAVLGNVSPLP